jgi:hypothetical protein
VRLDARVMDQRIDEDEWFALPEVELIAIESPDPPPRSRFAVPLLLIGVGGMVAMAATFWA